MYVNLLEQVLPIIYNIVEPATGSFKFRSMVSEEVNEIGVPVPTFSAWGECMGTVQPVNRSRYDALGLDWSKKYVNAWGSITLNTVDMDKQPCQILWQGYLWNVTSVDQWDPHNGWCHVMACQDKRYGGIDVPGGGEVLVEDPKTLPDPKPSVNSLYDWAQTLNKKIKG